MRQFLIDELPLSIAASELVLIAGKTGTGKTRVIEQLARAVDLEGLAHHRGSSFGQLLDEQPTQIDFENTLSVAMLKLAAGEGDKIYLEDEGRLIGRLYIPDVLREVMDKAPLLLVEESMQSRVDVVVEDYVVDLGARYAKRDADRGPRLHRERLLSDLGRIRKRLGGAGHDAVALLMQAAFDTQEAGGGVEEHGRWVEYLLKDYYDPMYEYQIAQREGSIGLRGSRADVLQAARRDS